MSDVSAAEESESAPTSLESDGSVDLNDSDAQAAGPSFQYG